RERGVARLAEARRGLDLLEAHDVRVERRERGDDLRLLASEVLGVRRATRVAAAVDRDGVAVSVAVVRAARELVARRREVVQDVEGRELDRPAHGLGRRGAGVLE